MERVGEVFPVEIPLLLQICSQPFLGAMDVVLMVRMGDCGHNALRCAVVNRGNAQFPNLQMVFRLKPPFLGDVETLEGTCQKKTPGGPL
jgi:hypothetical protein